MAISYLTWPPKFLLSSTSKLQPIVQLNQKKWEWAKKGSLLFLKRRLGKEEHGTSCICCQCFWVLVWYWFTELCISQPMERRGGGLGLGYLWLRFGSAFIGSLLNPLAGTRFIVAPLKTASPSGKYIVVVFNINILFIPVQMRSMQRWYSNLTVIFFFF